MMLLIHLNGLQIFSTEMDAQEVLVSLNNRDLEGTFLQIETPGRVCVFHIIKFEG